MRYAGLTLGLLAALLSACNAPTRAAGPAPAASAATAAGRDRTAPAASLPATVPLTVSTAAGERRFRVEVARTAREQERGLMFRERLAPDAGMIFPFSPPRPASFWMRNTLIPLDLIFVRADGSIARIAADATPRSLATIESGEPVAAVLEIAGGRAAQLGIAPGDRVRWPG